MHTTLKQKLLRESYSVEFTVTGIQKTPFLIQCKFYWMTFCHTAGKAHQFRELFKKAMKPWGLNINRLGF